VGGGEIIEYVFMCSLREREKREVREKRERMLKK
jgi:hypothetical protein